MQIFYTNNTNNKSETPRWAYLMRLHSWDSRDTLTFNLNFRTENFTSPTLITKFHPHSTNTAYNKSVTFDPQKEGLTPQPKHTSPRSRVKRWLNEALASINRVSLLILTYGFVDAEVRRYLRNTTVVRWTMAASRVRVGHIGQCGRCPIWRSSLKFRAGSCFRIPFGCSFF